MMAALILSVIEVPRDVILNDYMMTNDIPDTKLPVIAKAMVPRGTVPTDPEAIRRSAQVTRGQMEATFAQLDKKYGSVQEYLKQELGLTDADFSAISSRLLEQ